MIQPLSPPGETPRTDAEVVRRNYGHDMIPADLARQLERELRLAQEERDLAIAHDRQSYPTAAAYEAVCAALRQAQERLEEADTALRIRSTECLMQSQRANEAQERCAKLEKDAARWRFYEAAMKPGSGYQFGYGMPWLDSLKNEVQIEKDGEVIAKGRTLGAAIDAAASGPKEKHNLKGDL